MVPDVETLNNLYKVRHEFSSTILRSDYKSYYTEHDLDIFKRYRNKAKYGTFGDIRDIKTESLIEIDITKAYTAVFEKIDKVPVFNEFAIWKPYKNEPTKYFNLNFVQVNENSDFF